ncbi:MAG TPA: hypothetical protein VJM50_24045 [Pyrinomonadaceae bacterium]|nr:hypothetical protein [Pyrinomonadaceae bacterium]
MTRPPCHDRPPRADGMWVRNGLRRSDLKPIVRWVPAWSTDRCATWDGEGIGPKGEPYPVAHGWDCAGCRWDPREPKPVIAKRPTSDEIMKAAAIPKHLLPRPALPPFDIIENKYLPPGSYAVLQGGKMVMFGRIEGLKSKPAPAPSHFYRRFMEAE